MNTENSVRYFFFVLLSFFPFCVCYNKQPICQLVSGRTKNRRTSRLSLGEQRFNGRILLRLLFALLQNAAKKEDNDQHSGHEDDNEAISPLHSHVLADESDEVLHDLADDHVKEQDHASALRHVALEQKHGDGEQRGEQRRHEGSGGNQNDGSLFSQEEANDVENDHREEEQNQRLDLANRVNEEAAHGSRNGVRCEEADSECALKQSGAGSGQRSGFLGEEIGV